MSTHVRSFLLLILQLAVKFPFYRLTNVNKAAVATHDTSALRIFTASFKKKKVPGTQIREFAELRLSTSPGTTESILENCIRSQHTFKEVMLASEDSHLLGQTGLYSKSPSTSNQPNVSIFQFYTAAQTLVGRCTGKKLHAL